MSGSRARWLLLAAALAPLLASPAQADEAGPVDAEWVPSGVGSLTAPTYPADTLHVGAAVGQETDRTYLRFEVPADADDVTLTIPADPDAGTSAPETAVVLACAAPGFDPEAVDCDGAPTATFADGALTVALPAGGEVALVPEPGGDGSWHIGFQADAPRVTFEVAAPATTSTTRAAVSPSPPSRTPPGPLSVALPDLSPPPPVAAGQAIAEQAQITVPPTPAATAPLGATGGGFRYAAVFGLPLVLLVVVGLAGDGLTRPVRLREETT